MHLERNGMKKDRKREIVTSGWQQWLDNGLGPLDTTVGGPCRYVIGIQRSQRFARMINLPNRVDLSFLFFPFFFFFFRKICIKFYFLRNLQSFEYFKSNFSKRQKRAFNYIIFSSVEFFKTRRDDIWTKRRDKYWKKLWFNTLEGNKDWPYI